MRQPRPGTRYWRTAYGYCYRVDGEGTHPLGKHDLATFLAGADADEAAHVNGVWLDTHAVITLMHQLAAVPHAA